MLLLLQWPTSVRVAAFFTRNVYVAVPYRSATGKFECFLGIDM